MNSTLRSRCLPTAALVLLAMVSWPAWAPAGEPAAAPEALESPLTLSRCLLIALDRNPQLVASRQDVASARAGLTRVRSSYYPQLSLSAEEALGSGFAGVAGASDTERTERMAFSASQTLWQSGRRERVAQSQEQLAGAEYAYAFAVQSLLEQVASDYYGVLAADRLVEVQAAGRDSAARHLEEVQARIKVGFAAPVDEFTAQADLARADLALVDARRNATVSRARLKTTMGVAPTVSLDLIEPEAPVPGAAPPLAEALDVARQNRPDILRAETGVRAARYSLAQAEISRGPATDVSAVYDWGYDDWDARDASWDVGLRLSMPLFDGYASEADVRSARAALERSRAQLQSTLNNAGFDVESALADVQRARERVRATAVSVAAAEARLRAAEGKYKQGVGILLEVTDARAALTDARAQQVQADYDYRIALVALDRSLGVLSAPESGEE